MRTAISIITYLCCSIVILNTSCKEKNLGFEDGGALFRPIQLKANTETTNVIITWADLKEQNQYEVSLFDDNEELFSVDTVSVKTISYTLEGAKEYIVQVKVLKLETDISSEYAKLTFRTPAENLFESFSTRMTERNGGTIKWLPSANVTKLKLTALNATNPPLEYTIDASEKTAGIKVLHDLDNATYRVEIYNNNTLRGTTELTIEGDIFLPSGADLTAVISAAPNNTVIVLENGGLYTNTSINSKFTFLKSVKIMTISESNRAIIHPMTDHSASDLWGIKGDIDRIEFENIILNGAKGNTGSDNGRYLFRSNSSSETITLKKFAFINCDIKNYEVSFLFLAGGNKRIDSLVIDNCIIDNHSASESSAFIQFTNATDHIHNILISNSTFSKIRNQIINGENSSIESISILRSTFNDVAFNDGSNRHIMYFSGSTGYGTDKGIQIANCLFGKTTTGNTRGIEPGGLSFVMNSTFYTSDYDDSYGPSMKSKMIPYSGSSTSLWTNPANGDFTFKDLSFTGRLLSGDPRWR